ncbi:MAG: AAA family ATPase [Lachnospiraceae bacterium]|jgi:MoxR-like ATPase|nr:AAA family ATPase [Lachnospiraceae bacterium]
MGICSEKGKIIIENVERVIVGKRETVTLLLTALLARGHVLLEDMPGSGKTKLSKALARSLNAGFSRIQFTPDLLPSDVTGMNVFNRKSNEFDLRKGPVFTNILLADEINRATPRTQAGLLECMEERQVTIDGVSYPLEEPFFVAATQNPIETAGTFPLPEAQLDRFMMKLSLGGLSEQEEKAVLDRFGERDPYLDLRSVVTGEELMLMQKEAEGIFVCDALKRYMVEIARATRSRERVIAGVSTRGALALMCASRAYAALSGRDYCIPDDIKKLAVPVFAHRLVLSYGLVGGSGGYQKKDAAGETIREILKAVPAPTEDFSKL